MVVGTTKVLESVLTRKTRIGKNAVYSVLETFRAIIRNVWSRLSGKRKRKNSNMSSNNEISAPKDSIPTQTIPTNVVSFTDWKAGKRPDPAAVVTPTDAAVNVRPSKAKPKRPPVDNVARSLKAQSYLIEMYTDMLRLTVTALGEIERSNPASAKTSKIAHDAIATVGRIVNQVAIDLQEQPDKNDK